MTVVVDQRHDIVNISEVRHMNVGTNMIHWDVLQGLTKNIVDNVVVEGWGECKWMKTGQVDWPTVVIDRQPL